MTPSTRHLQPSDLRGRRWRGLVRESSAEQAKKDATPERQRADLRRAADELGLIAVEPLFYERVGSGEEEGVPELAQALADGKADQYDVLVVFHSSRFARNVLEARTMKREFAKVGVSIYFTSQRVLSGSYVSGLSEGLAEVLDEHENDQRRMWISGGIRERQRAGRWHGAIPFGYRRVLVDFPDGTRGWDGGLDVDPTTGPVVRDIFDQADAGAPLRAIARRLNLAGLRTVTGLPWVTRTVHRTLTNPAYKGHLVRYRRSDEPTYYERADALDGFADVGAVVPAIVSPAMFDGVGELLGRKARGGGGRRTHPYPLSRVLRCADCLHPMTGCFRGPTRYYRCSGRAERGICSAPMIRAERAEAAFATWLGSYRLPADWRAEIARTRVVQAKTDEGDRRRRLTERLDRIKKLYAWGDLTEPAYRSESTAIRSELGVIAMPKTGGLEDVAAALEHLAPAWSSAPPDLAAAVPGLMLHSGEVRAGSVEWVVRAELRPLLEMCVEQDPEVHSRPCQRTL
jgi:DNA invertase Pin-like site-specific DNA recombinase